MDNQPKENVVPGYICTLCGASGTDEKFKEFHNNTPITGLDLKAGDVFEAIKLLLNNIILITREAPVSHEHIRGYTIVSYTVDNIYGREISVSNSLFGANIYDEEHIRPISDELFNKFVKYHNENKLKITPEIRKGIIKQL